IHQATVLNTLNTSLNSTLYSFRDIRMHGHISAPILGSLDSGLKLGLCKGDNVQGTMRRRDATTGSQLDLRSALHKLLTHSHPDLIGTVRDCTITGDIVTRSRLAQ